MENRPFILRLTRWESGGWETLFHSGHGFPALARGGGNYEPPRSSTPRKWQCPLGASHGRSATAVAADFMQVVKSRSYLQAYNDLDDMLLVNLTADDFKSRAAHGDDC
jgi:hypothetical protein